AFGNRRAIDDEEAERAAADGHRAADMAMRIGRPDLASASLDGVGATLWPRGLYGSSLPIIERRLQLAETLEDPWELGDIPAVHAFGSAAFVLDARGDPPATELISLLKQQSSLEGTNQPLVWLAWILTRQGERDEVKDLLARAASIPSQVGRPFADQVRAAVLAEQEQWDEVPEFLQHAREFAARGGLRALPVHLDRLEGRAALAAGDT